MTHAILLISCPDHRGITAAITQYVYDHNGNILHAEQHTDEKENVFFMRIEWSMEGFDLGQDEIEGNFRTVAEKFSMKWKLYFTDRLPRVAVFASKHLHCLYDMLYRYKSGQFRCEIPLIISNHPDAGSVADVFGINFSEIGITPAKKREQEKKQLQILEQENIDTIIFARYMQIVGDEFIDKYENNIVNIHHSFLPAFAGKEPYLQAYQKGVKIIGATSHYVTGELDTGPIIEQDTVRISHKDSVEDLVRKGEDLERVVLSRAVRWHLERKILSYNNKTIVFD
ncbi:MAG: formyltetrahydrofolate deformylase [Candidatus Omnitrophica bacterium]|nr:formyltetrahydrofolate deformylase [Candidatus Omnitrophota bacterium]